jgi:hypothetical protein
MSKGQINYLLALATLIVVWLYFNTFYVGARRNYGGMPMGGIMATSAGRFQNPMGMQNVPQGMQNLPQSSNITELLKNQRRALQTSVMTRKMPPAPSEIPQKDKTAKS